MITFYIEAYLILFITAQQLVANWPGHDSGFAGDVQYSIRVELAAGKGKKRSVKKEGVQRERSSCGGEERRGDAPSHGVYSCKKPKIYIEEKQSLMKRLKGNFAVGKI